MDTQLREVSTAQRSSGNLAKLVCKLRWIGMEEEAQRLQAALREFPCNERETVLIGPPSTD
jgi:hypothetical protein